VRVRRLSHKNCLHNKMNQRKSILVLLLFAILLCVCVKSLDLGNLDREETLNIIRNKVPNGVPPDFECAWRALAYEYAMQLQPFRSNASFIAIHDGLQLTTLCNVSLSSHTRASDYNHYYSPKFTMSSSTVLYVDAASGNDNNDGSEASPLAHIATAVFRARGLPKPSTIILRGGVHRLTETLQLGIEDNGLYIMAYPSETPVITSGLLLNTTWVQKSGEQYDLNNCTWQIFEEENAMYGDWPSPSLVNATSAASVIECQEACSNNSSCMSFIYYEPTGPFGPDWNGRCFFRTDNKWKLKSESAITSGRCIQPEPLPNIFTADLLAGGTPLPPSITSEDSLVITILISTTPGEGSGGYMRAIRARFPNCDPEECLWPTGWESGGNWTPPHRDMNTTITHVSFPQNYGPGMFSDYWIGTGGPCSILGDGDGAPGGGGANSSYWCQPNGRVSGGLYFFRQPTGLTVDSLQLIHAPYANASKNGAILHYWRPSHWYSVFARIASATTTENDTHLTWTFGAFHGAEGSDSGEDWYVDHILEELDSPREFYFEAASQTLFYVHNASVGIPPPSSWLFEVPSLHCLINISGNATFPVENITFDGITFTGAAASFLQNHGISSGDWSIARIGSISSEGVNGLVIKNSTFTRLDGNAIVLNGFNRNVSIDRNEFYMLGESAVVSWGRVDGADARNGMQPWGTSMTRNLCHEIGIYEKQVSCYFAALTGNATITDNIFFNMPRAAINFNDDMAGGSVVARNLLFSTVLESQDHGPFNSWGRAPYIINDADGKPTGGLKAAPDEIHHNFLVAGGGANSGCIDNDDGSSFYNDHHNVCIYGGESCIRILYHDVFRIHSTHLFIFTSH